METEARIEDVVELLGLEGGKQQGYSRLWLAHQIAEGLPITAVDRVASIVFEGQKHLFGMIVSDATMKRRRKDKKPLSPENSERVERVARVWTVARDVFGGDDKSRRFMFKPHMLLDGKVPIEVAALNDVGADAVESLLGRLKYGSAA